MECDKTHILIILHKDEGDGGSNSSGDGDEVVDDELFGAEIGCNGGSVEEVGGDDFVNSGSEAELCVESRRRL
ncbi:hypothetical protein Acr_09g0007980 [Actinidia rufa]|uniref:Uncharacterized protein n=1 Tax=Actinidia rufa TaxID=165716 RepID=A0A7J0F6L1_9ERIC|nr:hypothetical protein Acr_09g0007980 [Actinidia rufa]